MVFAPNKKWKRGRRDVQVWTDLSDARALGTIPISPHPIANRAAVLRPAGSGSGGGEESMQRSRDGPRSNGGGGCGAANGRIPAAARSGGQPALPMYNDRNRGAVIPPSTILRCRPRQSGISAVTNKFHRRKIALPAQRQVSKTSAGGARATSPTCPGFFFGWVSRKRLGRGPFRRRRVRPACARIPRPSWHQLKQSVPNNNSSNNNNKYKVKKKGRGWRVCVRAFRPASARFSLFLFFESRLFGGGTLGRHDCWYTFLAISGPPVAAFRRTRGNYQFVNKSQTTVGGGGRRPFLPRLPYPAVDNGHLRVFRNGIVSSTANG